MSNTQGGFIFMVILITLFTVAFCIIPNVYHIGKRIKGEDAYLMKEAIDINGNNAQNN
jgi:hypothetical protein